MSILDLGISASENIVPGKGSLSAPICIVGEAPGADEVRYMQPFIGRAGTLLKKLMFQSGLALSDVYMTNVVKVRPPKNDIKPFYHKGTFSEEGKKWIRMLKQELSASKANVIVPLGTTALAALCGEEAVTKWRGSIIESTLLPGRKVIPSIHPSSAMRQYIWRYFITHDLRRAIAESAFPEIRRPERTYITNPSFPESMNWLQKIIDEKHEEVCLDIEISGQLQMSCIGFSVDPSFAISIPNAQFSAQDEMTLMLKINELIANPAVTIIGQNVSFDLSFMLNRYGIVPSDNIEDTMIAHNVLFPDFPKGLDFLNSIYTDEPYYKGEGKEWKKVRDWQMFWKYNCKDAATTLEIWQLLKQKLHKEGYWNTYRMDMAKHLPCFFMTKRGMRADPKGIAETQIEVQAKIDDAHTRLDKIIISHMKNKNLVVVDKETGREGYLNVNSPTQMKKYFYGDLNITPYLDKGRPTCDDKALQRLAKGTATRLGRPEAKIIQELVGLKKFRGTYLNMVFDEDQRFRADYRPRGTIFGRLSSSKTIFHTGMNMQNLPPQFKGFLKADPGYLLFEMDKVQAEWVATAYIANDQNMINIVESGQDPHVATAKLITRLSEEAIVAEHKKLGHATEPLEIERLRKELIDERPELAVAFRDAFFLPRTMSCRQCGKKANHGFNYGMGYKKFALMNELIDAESKMIHKGYHKAYPGLGNWYDRVKLTLSKNGRTLENCFGRKVRLLGMWGDSLFQQGYSFYAQSTIADMVSQAMIKTYNDSSSVMHPLELLGQIHDSLVFQYPLAEGTEKMAEAIHLVKAHLEPVISYSGRDFVVETDMKVGLDWSNTKEVSILTKEDTQRELESFIN